MKKYLWLLPIASVLAAILLATIGTTNFAAAHAAFGPPPGLPNSTLPCSGVACDGQGPSGGTNVPTGCWAPQWGPIIAKMGPGEPDATTVIHASDGMTPLGTLSIMYSTACETNWMSFVPSPSLKSICSYTPPQTSACTISNESSFWQIGSDQNYQWYGIDPGGEAHTRMIWSPNMQVGGSFGIQYPPDLHSHSLQRQSSQFTTLQQLTTQSAKPRQGIM